MSVNLPIVLWMIRSRKIVFDGHYTTDVLESLRRVASTILSYEFHWTTLIEHPIVRKVLHNFGGEDTLHRYPFGHLRKTIRDSQEIFVLP